MALPIGEGQTISPPFVVAYMTESIDPQPTDKVLEIGTGSGYQAAVLSALVKEVYTIEIVKPLGERAAKTLKRLEYDNVHAKVGDGYHGWPEHAPFDKIIVTCSPEKVPQALVDQLKEGGRMVIPVGERYQQTLYLLKKTNGKLASESLLPTLFVPMTGAAEDKRAEETRSEEPHGRQRRFREGRRRSAPGSRLALSAAGGSRARRRAARTRIACDFTTPSRAAAPRRCRRSPSTAAIVRQLEVSVRVCCKDVQVGPTPQQLPLLGVTFYDEDRATIGEKVLGPWRGTSDWKTETKKIDVPAAAREAIIRIGPVRGHRRRFRMARCKGAVSIRHTPCAAFIGTGVCRYMIDSPPKRLVGHFIARPQGHVDYQSQGETVGDQARNRRSSPAAAAAR